MSNLYGSMAIVALTLQDVEKIDAREAVAAFFRHKYAEQQPCNNPVKKLTGRRPTRKNIDETVGLAKGVDESFFQRMNRAKCDFNGKMWRYPLALDIDAKEASYSHDWVSSLDKVVDEGLYDDLSSSEDDPLFAQYVLLKSELSRILDRTNLDLLRQEQTLSRRQEAFVSSHSRFHSELMEQVRNGEVTIGGSSHNLHKALYDDELGEIVINLVTGTSRRAVRRAIDGIFSQTKGRSVVKGRKLSRPFKSVKKAPISGRKAERAVKNIGGNASFDSRLSEGRAKSRLDDQAAREIKKIQMSESSGQVADEKDVISEVTALVLESLARFSRMSKLDVILYGPAQELPASSCPLLRHTSGVKREERKTLTRRQRHNWAQVVTFAQEGFISDRHFSLVVSRLAGMFAQRLIRRTKFYRTNFLPITVSPRLIRQQEVHKRGVSTDIIAEEVSEVNVPLEFVADSVVFETLSEEDRQILVDMLEEVTTSDSAARIGISRTRVHNRRHELLPLFLEFTPDEVQSTWERIQGRESTKLLTEAFSSWILGTSAKSFAGKCGIPVKEAKELYLDVLWHIWETRCANKSEEDAA